MIHGQKYLWGYTPRPDPNYQGRGRVRVRRPHHQCFLDQTLSPPPSRSTFLDMLLIIHNSVNVENRKQKQKHIHSFNGAGPESLCTLLKCVLGPLALS